MAIGETFGAVMQSDMGIPGGVASYDENQAALAAKLPIYGKGENLLRNWYFVGGGSQQGGGQFPINSRGQTSYSSSSAYCVDGWKQFYLRSLGTLSVLADGLALATGATADSLTCLYQMFEQGVADILKGKTCTLSVLSSAGLSTVTFPFRQVPGNIEIGNGFLTTSNDTYHVMIHVTNGSAGGAWKSPTITAAKLELGDTQTLAHQDEDGNWVLNEIPDYEEELIRCQTSKADSADAYANKDLATQQQLATVEQTGTASRAYAVGEYLCYNGLLYRVTVAIAAGGAITPGTNCESTTVVSEMRRSVDLGYLFGESYSPIDIDKIGNYHGYMFRIVTGNGFSGTSPTSILGGNAFLLIGFSHINPSNNLPIYGVQIAIGFQSNSIAIRNADYTESGKAWGAWKAIS